MYISFENLMGLLRGWEAEFLKEHIGYMVGMSDATEPFMRAMFYADRLKLTEAVLDFCSRNVVDDDDLFGECCYSLPGEVDCGEL